MNPITDISDTVKYASVAVVVVIVVAVGYYIYDAIGDNRELKIEHQSIQTEKKVENAKDIIRSHRPDRDAVIDSLFRAQF